MFVRARPELVSLKLEDDIDPHELTGDYLSPKEFKEAILDEDTVVIDARNDYEYDLDIFVGLFVLILEALGTPKWIRDHKEEFMENEWLLIVLVGFVAKNFLVG